jgi:hypothetical protein
VLRRFVLRSRCVVAYGSPAATASQWDDAIPGTNRFYTTDPWGNRIEVVAGSVR